MLNVFTPAAGRRETDCDTPLPSLGKIKESSFPPAGSSSSLLPGPLLRPLLSQPLLPLPFRQGQPDSSKNLGTQLLSATTKLSIYVFIDRVVYLIQGDQRQQHLQYLWNKFNLNLYAVYIKSFHQGQKYISLG